MNGSPLGKYAAPAAAVASVAIISVYLLSLVFGHVLAISDVAEGDLQAIAFLAAGALFGSAVAVNGYKEPLTAATNQVAALTSAVSQLRTATVATHKRLDDAGVAPAADGSIATPIMPVVPIPIAPAQPTINDVLPQ